MAQPLPLPTRFPCWVRAVYSWGGETKKDLGFMEGDLIECLNAGDGSWWTGRLRRDRRIIGLFPSNFVQVLEDCYQPGGSRAVSPMPQRKASDQPPVNVPVKQDLPKAYRKPFQSYQKPVAGKETISRENSGAQRADTAQTSRKPFSSMKRESGGGSPGASRSPSPMNPVHRPGLMQPTSRRGSPSTQSRLRATSPISVNNGGAYSKSVNRTGSYREGPDDFASPPPPAPPPHRYTTSRVGTPQPEIANDYDRARTPVQEHREPGQGFTPSPLTHAMNDVMQCLEDIHLMKHDDSLDFGQGDPGEQYDSHSQRYHDEDQFHVAPLSRTGSVNTFQPSVMPNLDLGMMIPAKDDQDSPPAVPPKGPLISRPHSSLANFQISIEGSPSKSLAHRKSAYELGRNALNRTYTTKTNVTESSNATNHTVASIASAGAFSATSAGSFYRRKEGHGGYGQRPKSALGTGSWSSHNMIDEEMRPHTPSTGISYHTSHASGPSVAGSGVERDWEASIDIPGHTGGLTSTPRAKKSGFFKRMVDSAKTGAATARSTISAATSNSRPGSPVKSKSKSDLFGQSFENIPVVAKPQRPQSSHARMYGSDEGSSWVQVRRDINRANSLSRNERDERAERCQLLDIPVIAPIEEMQQLLEGEEGLDGLPITDPKDLSNCNYTLVDKNARFADNVPKYISIASLVQGYLCRPYRSDVQRLRSIFTWVSEKITWEEDYGDQEIDTRRVLSSRRGCAQEIALLVSEMCSAVGIQAEVVEGYLKFPSTASDNPEMLYSTILHHWNAVVVEGEWRIMDCSLASPTNPNRNQFLGNNGPQAESWWFLTLPSQSCYTHVPLHHEHQHIVPPLDPSILYALPCTSPPYFRNSLQMTGFYTSLVYLENLDVAQLRCLAPEDIELVAEIHAKGLSSDIDGDRFENGEIIKKRALCQADWIDEAKRWTIKALLPPDVGEGMLKVYAGKKGLMHSIKSNPHNLAFTLPIRHTGQNPPFDFVLRHPTPHAQRHDLYIVTPQCATLLANNTFVFTVRQHRSTLNKPSFSATTFDTSTLGSLIQRPSSAMSMVSISASGSNYSGSGSGGSEPSTTSSSSSSSNNQSGDPNKKPAKLAIQSPSGKIIRLARKIEGNSGRPVERHDGSDWETVIKVGERGPWRALVLADRSARWCVFGEWECV